MTSGQEWDGLSKWNIRTEILNILCRITVSGGEVQLHRDTGRRNGHV